MPDDALYKQRFGRMLEALQADAEEDAHEVVRLAMADGARFESVALEIILAAYWRVASGISSGRTTYAQRHRASLIAAPCLDLAKELSKARPKHGRSALVFCVEGDHGWIHPQATAYLLELDGWHVDFMAGNVPATDAVIQVYRGRYSAILVSAGPLECVPALRDTLAALNKTGKDHLVMIAGIAAKHYARSAPDLKARVVVHTQEAVALCRELLDEQGCPGGLLERATRKTPKSLPK